MNIERMKSRGVLFYLKKKAYIREFSFKFNKISHDNPGEGYANIVYSENSIVEGLLYEISEDGLYKLDKYENHPIEYRRELVKVQIHNKSVKSAHVYVANDEYTRDDLLPSSMYISHLLKAKDYISDNHYNFLKNHKTL
ncbi:MAG: hypothetical protein GTO02_20540 [Candidatus Dadabacteria bacterium]|nr:hypothetical protein [Candidatus Dadabacteria bacterium]